MKMEIHTKTPWPFWILVLLVLATLGWWAFAFAPLPSQTPAWVEQARVVCFGSSANGLPEAYGWIMLVGGPLLLLTTFLSIWQNELAQLPRLIRASRFHRILILVLLLGIVGEALLVTQKIRTALASTNPASTAELPLSADYPRTQKPAPDFSLIDQHGKKVTLATVKGRPVLLSFAFAHCTALCPTLVSDVLKAAKLAADLKPQIILLSLDPWRDTPGSLPGLAKSWNLPENAYILSGEVSQVEETLEAYNVPYQKDEKTGQIAHPALVYILDGTGEIAYTLNAATAGQMAEALRRLF